MSMNSDRVTVRGNIGNDPIKGVTPTGLPVVNFRVGSSAGYWDRSTGAWVDQGTSWYAVSAFRNLAEHAKASLRCGDAVIISGSLKVREWESNGRKGVSAEIVADAIGHDLNRGTSAFVRRPRSGAASAAEPSAESSAESAQTHPGGYRDDPTSEESEQWDAVGLTDPELDAQGAMGPGRDDSDVAAIGAAEYAVL